MTIYFDMDGTIADLYGVENWLNDLINSNTRPYDEAKPLINFSALARQIHKMQKIGFTFGIVSWLSKSGTEEYNVHIDIKHPRKSTCTCPFADGRRVICKHMVATFFTIYPEEAERIIKEEQEYEEEEERLFEEHLEEVREYVNGLTEDEVRALLIDKLMDEWYDDDYRW